MSTIAVLLSLFFRQVKEDKFKRLTGRPNQPSGKAGCGTKGDGSKERRSLWVDGVVVDRLKKKKIRRTTTVAKFPRKKGESLLLLLPLFLFHSLLIRFSLLQLVSTRLRSSTGVGRGPRSMSEESVYATHLIITSCSFSADSFFPRTNEVNEEE